MFDTNKQVRYGYPGQGAWRRFEALAFSGQKKGFVITLNQSDSLTSNDMTAQIMPVWKFLGKTADELKFF